MKLSNSFFITRRELPKDEESAAMKLLVKSGMVVKNDSGIYTYLPLGKLVLDNIINVIKEEFKNINASEVVMPNLVSSKVFEDTGRKSLFGDELFTIKSNNNREYALCPTHEELFASLAKYKIQSYKDLHFTLYQIDSKYRDEIKDEYGLIRKKEFLMADAYSFDANDGGADISYDRMYLAFQKIFNKLGLDVMVVGNDPQYMKGLSSEEFQVISEYGDNEVVKCKNCTYASNIEDAACKSNNHYDEVKQETLELIDTPNVKTIKDISDYLHISPNKIIKSIIVKVDDVYKMILLRGTSKINALKLMKVLKSNNITIPSVYELVNMGTYPGFIGPIDSTMEIIADNDVKGMMNAICGGNKKDYHYANACPGRDFRISKYADLKLFDENCVCPKCKSECEILKGIEVGHIFKLGSNYSLDYDLKYIDEKNIYNYVHMNSYGIGVDRTLAAIVEKNHDDKGIIWPMKVAPFRVAIVIANVNDKDTYKYANLLYLRLNSLGIPTLLDDRKESIGVKFNDMELIGIPIRVTVGKDFDDELVELKIRSENSVSLVKTSELISKLRKLAEF